VGDDPGIELAASLYQAAFDAAHLPAMCEIARGGPKELEAAVARLRSRRSFVGAAVFMPDTVLITGRLDGLGPEAQSAGAVNTVSHKAGRLIGWNTDRAGFARALEESGFTAEGKTVLVLGAGGAARACVDVIRDAASRIWVAAPDLDQARVLCRDLRVAAGGPTPIGSLALLVKKVELIINATPVGTDGKTMLFPAEWLTPSHFVFDLVYSPALTPLVGAARERGARAVNGLSMLLFQALAAFEIWVGQPAPEGPMRAALERAVLEHLTP
jgi:shikimate dehydrogenase